MANITAVELGADMCALARTNVRRGEVQLLAADSLDPAAFPGIEAFTAAIRQTRKSLKLSKRCRAVVWGLPDGAARRDPSVKPLIAPLVGAGFRVDRVTSPCNALAALARLKLSRGEGATCWLAINRTGVAIVVVRPGKQLYSHSFAWDSNVGASGSQARLLQRYSLVAFLAPEIRRAMNAAREKGAPVDAIVTCGNLPEIRSLTMPLIEELDVEVESLDSLEGLIVKPDATDRLSEVAASLRIACAGAIARPTRRRDESKGPSSPLGSVGRIAAAAAAILGVGFIAWSWWKMPSDAPPVSVAMPAKATPKQAPPPRQAVPPKQTPPPATQTSSPKQTPAPVIPPPKPSAPVTAVNRQAPPSTKQVTPQPSVAQAAKRAAANTPSPTSHTTPAPVVSEVRKPAESKPSAPQSAKPFQPSPAPVLPPARGASLDTRPNPADKPDAVEKGQRARGSSPPRPMPELLKDPVPRVTAILISSDRRMATIDDGRIIGVGEMLGRRLVVAIDDRAVVLKEPSGVQIRVGLGGRVLGVERAER